MIITPDQTQGKCPEDPKEKGVSCTNDGDCQAMEPVKDGHGELCDPYFYSQLKLIISPCFNLGCCQQI